MEIVVVCACVVLCLSLQNEPRLKSRTSTEELSGVSLKALKVDRKKVHQERRANGRRAKSEGCNNVRFRERMERKWKMSEKILPATTRSVTKTSMPPTEEAFSGITQRLFRKLGILITKYKYNENVYMSQYLCALCIFMFIGVSCC